MKKILLILILSVGYSFIFCQIDSSYSNKKFEYSLHLGINNSFIEGKNGIYDYFGFTPKDLTLGFSLGAKVKYSINNHISLLTGITLMSFEKNKFKYYGYTYSQGEGKPQIPFIFQYHLSHKNNKESWFLSLGTILTFKATVSDEFYYYPQRLLTFESSRIRSYILINPLLQIGIGKSRINKSRRRIEQVLFLNKGFNNIKYFHLNRLNSKIESNFVYRGTTLNYSFRWYFKRK